MGTKGKSETLDIQVPLGDGVIVGLRGMGTSHALSQAEKVVVELAKRFPGVPVRMIRRELGKGNTLGYGHIPQELWDSIFKNEESDGNGPK